MFLVSGLVLILLWLFNQAMVVLVDCIFKCRQNNVTKNLQNMV